MKWVCMGVLIHADLAPVCWRPTKSQEVSAVTSHLGNSPNPHVACSIFLRGAAAQGYTPLAFVNREKA